MVIGKALERRKLHNTIQADYEETFTPHTQILLSRHYLTSYTSLSSGTSVATVCEIGMHSTEIRLNLRKM